MQQEQQQKKEAKQKSPNKVQRMVADTLRTTLNTKQNPNNPRRILAGSVLATCLAFLIAILSQKVDVALLIAACLFAVPIPFLTIGFLLSSYDFEDQRFQWLSEIAFLFEKIGMILVMFGILLVEYHISPYVFWSTLSSFILFLIVTVIILLRNGINLSESQISGAVQDSSHAEAEKGEIS